ncbi:MAG: class E sortase [Actinomycetota bacterium]|nr:class E sortase [Actinomycetota bacterium]
MKTYNTGGMRRGLTAVLSAFVAVVGLGLLGYTLFGGGSPASAAKNKFAPEAPAQTTLKLTVPEMERVEDVPVYDGRKDNKAALRKGTLHVKGTGYPWQRVANVYIAGHRLGFPGTKSHLVFWDLDRLENGDEVILTDANGTTYTYEVFKKFVVSPTDVHVMRPVAGKNIVSLQTCTLPDYAERLIVQAELKSMS